MSYQHALIYNNNCKQHVFDISLCKTYLGFASNYLLASKYSQKLRKSSAVVLFTFHTLYFSFYFILFYYFFGHVNHLFTI